MVVTEAVSETAIKQIILSLAFGFTGSMILLQTIFRVMMLNIGFFYLEKAFGVFLSFFLEGYI